MAFDKELQICHIISIRYYRNKTKKTNLYSVQNRNDICQFMQIMEYGLDYSIKSDTSGSELFAPKGNSGYVTFNQTNRSQNHVVFRTN